jgi:hypothetical protein
MQVEIGVHGTTQTITVGPINFMDYLDWMMLKDRENVLVLS